MSMQEQREAYRTQCWVKAREWFLAAIAEKACSEEGYLAFWAVGAAWATEMDEMLNFPLQPYLL